MNQKYLAYLFIILTIVVVGGITWYEYQKPSSPSTIQPSSGTGTATGGEPSAIQKAYADKLAACKAIPSESTQEVVGTSRVFINLPKDIYPDKDHNLQFHSADPTATAGSVTNAGPYGEAQGAPDGCWSYYYEFNGGGIIDLTVKSAQPPMPDYHARFVVQSGS